MPKIIISYRRADSGVITGRIRDRLAQHYGDDSIFMDIDNIPFGMDFRRNIADALAKNDLLLAVIGPDWLGAASSGLAPGPTPGPGSGLGRIHDPDDPVRIEVETALQRGIPTIPVLVGGANMPSADALPDSLKSLSFHNAAEVDSGRDFHAHLDRLIRSMDAALKGKSWRSWQPFAFRRLSRGQAGIGVAGSMAVMAAVVFALYTRDSGPVFIGNITVIESQYLQFYGAPPTVDVKQLIAQAIELANSQQYDRALEAFSKIPAEMRVPAVWNDLGVVFERLNDVTNARAAYQAALAKDPGFTLAKSNLTRLESAAAPVAVGSAKSATTVAASSGNDINLLAPEEGGQLLAAPNESWRKITSGKEDEWIEIKTGTDADSDAVYAFKDRKPARFHKLTVLIAASSEVNPKEIEVLAGDEGATGSFRSVGKCTLTNRLLFETRYQECELPPTTARFVKLKVLSSYHYNAWAHVPQVRLLGRLSQ
jgi:tetratricopeptide (TPR) repeat protein